MIRTASWRHRGVAAVTSMLLLAASSAWAGTVTTASDSGAGSLRTVVAAGGTVTFAAALNGQTITLTSGQIAVPSGTTITGPGANLLTVSTAGGSRIFNVGGTGVSISGLSLTNGNAGSGGQGGAIFNSGTLALSGLAITASFAGDAGGAIFNTGSLTVSASLLSGNFVVDTTCAGGGAIRSQGAGSSLTIVESTITNNVANSCSGGGISFNDGAATITDSTISGNTAFQSGGNVYKGSTAAVLTLSASVVSGGTVSAGGTPVNADVHGALGGGLVSSGYNLVNARGDSIGYVATDLADGTSPLLSVLAPHGGPTANFLPQLNSPLRDARPAPCPTSADQRGFARPQGTTCDIGSVEYRHNALTANIVGSGTVSASVSPTPLSGSISNCSTSCSADYDGELAPTVTLTATPNAGQAFSAWSGACSGASSSTSVVMSAVRSCTATFVPLAFTVTPSVSGGNGTINPSTPQTITSGATTSFTLSPSANYHIANVTGTCGGSLAGNVYTTNAISANCTVIASFAIDTHVVTPSVSGGNGTIAPATAQTVNHGSSTSFTLTPSANYHVANVTGTCGGNLAGNVYTTNAVVADCTVIASFAIDTHTVTPSVNGGNGTIAPATPQTVNHGATTSFTLTPSANYHIGSVTGSCGGSLAGNVYTTNAVNADCSVIANFAIDTHVVTPSVTGGNGTIAPATPQTVNHGATTSFTLTPSANYHVGAITGTCGGSLAGNVYTTAAVNADCTVIASFTIDTHTVTPSVTGGNGTIAPATPQTVNHGATTSFTLTPSANYHIGAITGTCGGSLAGNVYTTAAVNADCTVIASFTIDAHTVTPSVTGGNGTIAPATPQSVNHGATTSFTLTPAANYHIGPITGTCGGTLAGNVYTTAAVNADCTVIASFAIDTHTVTPSVGSGNGAIAPATPQTVNHGATTSFTLTPGANYHVGTVTGTCGGSLAGNVYTTAAVNADCTVIANFAIDTHTVTPSVTGGNGTIAPATPQSVNHGATTSFTLAPAANYHIGPITGTCGGALAGNVYTTNAVNADCTVIASFAIDTHTVTPSVTGGNGTIAPATPQTVNHGATTSFTLTPAANYHIGPVTGTCGGSLAGNVYTTNAVNADCTVIASFTIDTHTVTPSVTGGNGTIAPATPQTVNHGATTTFTLTPAANHHIGPITGTCGGSLAGNVYTTNAVNADCTVIASFAVDTHTVTPSVGTGNGTITPPTPQAIDHGATTSFTLSAATSYHLVNVTGTCGGSLAANVYTTSAITADCTVIANFAIDTHTVGGTVSGLIGSDIVLKLNGGNDLLIVANGSFVFPQPLNDLSAYAVTIAQQPVGPAQICTITNGSGTLAGSDITNVAINCPTPQPHLTLTLTDQRDYVRYGMLLDYVVTVSNDGNGAATGVTVANVSPPQLDAGLTTWVCHGAGSGATCAASGTGALNDTGVSIPAGRSLTWVVTAPLRLDAAGGTVAYTVNVSGAGTASATDTDALVILRTGTDVPYGDGAETGIGDEAHAACTPAGVDAQRFDLTATRLFALPSTVASAPIDIVLTAQAAGGSGFRVERLNVDRVPQVRLVTIDKGGVEHASAWAPTSAGAWLAIGTETVDGHSTVLLEGSNLSLDLLLPDGVDAKVLAQTPDVACD